MRVTIAVSLYSRGLLIFFSVRLSHPQDAPGALSRFNIINRLFTMTRNFRGAIKKLPDHISCRFMPTARWTLYLHIYS